MSNSENLTREQREKIAEWVESEGKEIAAALFRKRVLQGKVRVESRWMLPGRMFVGVAWSETHPGPKYWVTGGEWLVRDYVPLNVAETPRDAARHFALQWQLNGARIGLASEDESEMDWKAAEERMAKRAEALYQVVAEDALWR